MTAKPDNPLDRRIAIADPVEPGSETPKLDGIYVKRRYRNRKG